MKHKLKAEMCMSCQSAHAPQPLGGWVGDVPQQPDGCWLKLAEGTSVHGKDLCVKVTGSIAA